MKPKLTILLSALFFLGFPSCHCPDFYLITGVQRFLFFDQPNQTYKEGGEITTDTLYIQLFIEVEEYTDSGLHEIGFMSTTDAYSIQCATPWANSMVSITFFSNNDFNDIPAGQPLNPKLWNSDFNIPVDSIPLLFRSDFGYGFDMTFQFLEKPTNAEHTFSVVIVDNAANTFTFHAQPLTWL